MTAMPATPIQTPQPRHIRVLPEEVASKIAAGEVVERPASVVRELVDNAIDAGADQIRVELKSGGRELIRVVDDGCGISPRDMPRAFLRHATSKITTADDLWAVRTLGFRGEALFSIAAVSLTTIASRESQASGGYELSLEGGRIAAQGPKGMPVGSVVTVRDLFYNLPARLKFLKSAPAEGAYIAALLQQYALAHPHIRFSLTSDGRLTFQSPGGGVLRQAAVSVYGPEVARQLLPVGLEPAEADEWEMLLGGGGISVFGYTSPPTVSRSNRSAMHFFINRRAVQSRMLQYAVAEAYHSLLMVGRHPLCIVNVLVDPASVDVNVHPAKSEVKFRDERSTFSAVQRAVRSALTAHITPPQYGTRGSEGWAESTGGIVSGDVPWIGPAEADPPRQGDLWREEGSANSGAAVEPLPPPTPRNLPPLRVVGQVGMTYIIAEGPDGLFLVDQHAAHERILYERLGDAIANRRVQVQPLLQPLVLELPHRQRSEIEPILPLMQELGFEFEAFGESTLLVRAVPAMYAASNRDMGGDLLSVLDTVLAGSAPERWREEIAITLACHSAVRAGKQLSLDEMRAMLEQLELCRYPRSCAHGRPTILHLSQAQLEREFGRRA